MEYDKEGELIFEGEYIKGVRNGKGKEYRVSKDHGSELIFEGEYLNGQKWNGKGKEYDKFEHLLFDGEYLNGQKWNGIYKEYYYDKIKVD